MEQLVARQAHNLEVVRSSRAPATKHKVKADISALYLYPFKTIGSATGQNVLKMSNSIGWVSPNNVKKMCSDTNKKLSFVEIEKYRLPIYNKKSKDKVVYFYVLDPQSILDGCPKMKRIRKKFAHIHSAKERDEAALRFRDEIARKLKEGWNPLIADNTNKSFSAFEDVLNKYQKQLNKLCKDGVYTDKTYTDYCNRIRMLRSFNSQLPTPIIYIYMMDRAYIEDFLEYIYVDRDTSPRTRNNYLGFMSSLCTWLRKNGYIKYQMTDDIPPLRESEKKRKPLSDGDMKRLSDYLQDKNKPFLLACMLQYYTFVRPGELSQITIGDISVKEQTMFVSHKISKNRKDGVVTIPARAMRLMIDLGIFSNPSDYYLFGKDFMPTPERQSSRIFREQWIKVRKSLGFPNSYQFYSLKDTGITDVIDSAGLTTAKDQARHSSVQVTNAYVRKDQHSVHPELKNFEGSL